MYVLQDSRFSWLLNFSDSPEDLRMAQAYLSMACGMVRGCLFTFGCHSIVTAEPDSTSPHFASCKYFLQKYTFLEEYSRSFLFCVVDVVDFHWLWIIQRQIYNNNAYLISFFFLCVCVELSL